MIMFQGPNLKFVKLKEGSLRVLNYKNQSLYTKAKCMVV